MQRKKATSSNLGSTKINKKDLNNVNNILSLYSDSEIKQKQDAVRYYYENYYTYDANVRLIENHLNNQ